jgi:hypothetical protein
MIEGAFLILEAQYGDELGDYLDRAVRVAEGRVSEARSLNGVAA